MATYNPYQQMIPQVPYNIQTPPSPMIWVKGIQQAENYPTGPNATIILWDSERDTIYIKSTDVLGKPSMKVLDYTFRDTTPKEETPSNPQPSSEYVTKSDLADFMNQVMSEIKQLKTSPNRKFKED